MHLGVYNSLGPIMLSWSNPFVSGSIRGIRWPETGTAVIVHTMHGHLNWPATAALQKQYADPSRVDHPPSRADCMASQ